MNILGSLGSLKSLHLGCCGSITSQGWHTLSTLLQNHNCTLTKLDIYGNTHIDDEAVLHFANALVNNTTLTVLNLDDNMRITERGWTALSNMLCDKSSIGATYSSNHTLRQLADEDEYELEWEEGVVMFIPSDLLSLLHLNMIMSKTEVARLKILFAHMLNDDNINVEAFTDMELDELPSAISWLGRDDVGLSVLYRVCESLPSLFECNAKVLRCER